MTSRLELCSVNDVAEGAALKIESGNLTLAVFNVGGRFYVMNDQCTHGPGSMSESIVEGDIVECNFHGGQFNILTGAVVAPPCLIAQTVYPVSIENGKVFIEI